MDRRLARLRFAFLVGVLVLGLLPNFGTPAVASPRASGQIVAHDVVQSWPSHRAGALTLPSGTAVGLPDTGSTGDPTLLLTSDVIDAGQLFDRVGVHWIVRSGLEDSVVVEVRTSANGTAWTDWHPVLDDEDMANLNTNEQFGTLVAADSGRYAQYRVWLTSGDADAISRMSVTFMDTSDLNAGPLARFANDVIGALRDFAQPSQANAAVGATRILTRQDWAADETLMQWPAKYQKVQKFIIHHTVTDDGGSNVAASIRAIYYYHAVTRGWGDIGYNYIVDKFGNIWTGRQGGDNVIAGHAYGWNNGSIGIAALGDYSLAQPTSALQGAIANIIGIKATQFGIQPFGADPFVHQEQAPDGAWVNVTSSPPNVQGHRDANYILNQHGGQTACPGNGIYNMIDGLRRLAQNAVQIGYVDMPYLEPQLPKAAVPGTTISVGVVVTNRGASTIPAGTGVSYRVLQNGQLAVAQGGVGTINAPIAPGATGMATIPFAVPALGNYIVRFDLQTGGAWWNTTKNTPVHDVAFRAADWSADWVSDNVPIAWVAGEVKMINVTVANDGGRPWPATGTNPVKLGYKWVSNATGNTFPGATKTSLANDVQPGQTVQLTIPVVAPTYPTNYTMYLDLYKENEFAFADRGIAPDDTPTGVSLDFKATYLAQPPTMTAGQTATVPVTITNAGRGVFPTTSSYPVNLAYHWYNSAGQSVLWDGARTKLPADLQPGAQVTLQAQVTAPSTGGSYQLRFDLVQEGVAWFSLKGVPTGTYPIAVQGPVIPAFGAGYEPASIPTGMAGTQTTVPVTVRNNSNFTWLAGGANPITLSYHWSTLAGTTVLWDGARTKLTTDLAAGASAQLQANLAFPAAAGTYKLRWDMVQEGISWFSGKGVPTLDQTVTVNANVPPFYGGSLDVSGTPASLAASATSFYSIRVQNLSNFTWGGNVNLSYHWYDAAGNVVAWDGVRTSLAGINVQEVRTVSVKIAAPSAPGTYTLRYDIVQEGVAWFSGQGMQTPTRTVAVAVAPRAAVYTTQSTILTGALGATITIPVTITNVGSLAWQPGVVNASYHLIASSGNVYVWDGLRTALPSVVAPGQSVTVNLIVKMPAIAGTFEIRVDAVHEGVTWFSGQGIAPASLSLVVQ